MTSRVTLQALSNDDLLIEKINSKTFVWKTNLVIYSKTRFVLLDPITEHH